jgi:hypothetical protein
VREAPVINPSDVYVCELITRPNAATEASVSAVVLTVLDVRPAAQLYRWTVAVTPEQALRLRDLPWVITPRQRGEMYQDGENLEFHDPERGETWSVSIESLAR